MAQVIDSLLGNWTAVDLVQRFGPIPLARVRMNPAPGTATEQDLVAINERKQGLCELVDGTLVEKTVGWYESYLAVSLAALLHSFVRQHALGLVLGADGATRLMAGLVRVPDVAFYSASSLPHGGAPRLPFMPVAPTLAVEVISPSNTRQEMDRKLQEYFSVGVSEVWYVYPVEREVHRYLAQDRFEVCRAGDSLATTQLLPGFELDLEDFFQPPGSPTA